MAQYYFTGATLPMLTFDEEPYYSCDEVIDLCRRELPTDDMDVIRRAARYFEHEDPAETFPGILGAFHTWERSVRIAVARLRAQDLGREETEERFRSDPEAERIARDMINQASPLQAEMLLQRARWEFLDRLEAGHYFDLSRLIIYVLKTRVAERNQQIDTELGAERFNEIYSHMVQALSERSE